MIKQLNNRIQAADTVILELVERKIRVRDDFFKLHKSVVEKCGVSMLTNDELTKSYHNLVKNKKISSNKYVEELIRLKRVRSMSGIVVVSILTKPYDCPGNCLYCPSQKGLPKSYMKNEPAVMRAIANNFDPYRQVQSRLKALSATGHQAEKINIRVIGGTWSYYPRAYQSWFIKRCYTAANEFDPKPQKPNPNDQCQIPNPNDQCSMANDQSQNPKSQILNSNDQRPRDSLLNQQQINETAKQRIVEISIETRQDYIDKQEIVRLRKLGVTKVELGVQSVFDDVLTINRRGHDVRRTIEATTLLKDAGFKVAYQVMLNLAGSDLNRDEKMLEELFLNPDFRPDYLKIYPLAIVKEAPIYKLYKQGKHKPYTKEELSKIITNFKISCPKYLRIERIIRDIPSNDIVEGGAKISNLRQIIKEEMAKAGTSCNCIRCREIRNAYSDDLDYKLFREDYEASDGKEIFLTFESSDRSKLISILRLRIPSNIDIGHHLTVLNKCALVREVHTYGPQLAVGTKDEKSAQHQGFGKKLIGEAENIVKNEYGLHKIAIISGVGARPYFRKLGYELKNTYMIKSLN